MNDYLEFFPLAAYPVQLSAKDNYGHGLPGGWKLRTDRYTSVRAQHEISEAIFVVCNSPFVSEVHEFLIISDMNPRHQRLN